MKFGTPDLTDLSIFEELNTPNPNKSRHLKILREILDTNRYLETTDGRGRTPLMFAIVKKDIAAVKLILRYHPNLNKIAIIPGKTSTPLMEAVTIQSFTITKLLVDAGADVYLRVPPDNKNVIDTVDDLLELTWIHHDMRNKLTRIKNYLLKANHSARVIQGNFRKYITKKKLDSANIIKRNYLNYAYKPGGPGYNRAKKHFETAFGVRRRRNNPALRYRNYDIFQEIDNPKTNDIWEIVEPTTHARRIRNYLARDRSLLEKIDGFGRTPLMAAVLSNDPVAVKVILAFHPDLNKIYRHFTFGPVTPLMAAAILENSENIRMLVNAGADISLRSNGRNAIDILNNLIEDLGNAGFNVNEIIKKRDYLLKANHSSHVIQGNYKKYLTKKKIGAANVIKKNYLEYSYAPGGPGYNRAKKHFETAFGKKRNIRLNYKMKFGNRSIFEEINKKVNSKGEPSTKRTSIVTKMLLKNISLLNSLDENGMTPLMKAVREDDKEMLDLLIYKFEPDLNVFSNIEGTNMTPLILAAVTANLPMVKILINAGADISIRNDRNKNVYDIVNRQIRMFRDWKAMREAYEKVNDYLLKAKHSANVIKQHYKVYDTKRKTNAVNVIKRNYLEYAYAPGGPGYNRAKKHFESAFGKKRIDLKMLRSELKKVLK